MKRIIILLFTAAMATACFAQLTLEECKDLAHANYPAIKQYGLIELSTEYSVQNAARGFLPSVSIGAGAYAFTDIIDKTKMPTMEMKNHMLNANVQINQTIYDGGAIAARKDMARAQSEVNKSRLSVTIYNINNRITQLYFGILTLDAQAKQNNLLQSDLALSRKTVESMIKGGVANQSDLDAVEVEQIKAQQAEGSIASSRRAYLAMLGTFIGKKLDSTTTLAMSNTSESVSDQPMNRPELNYYTAENVLLDARRKSLDAQLRPRVSAFGMGLWHNEITPIAKNTLFAAGLTLSWNITPLYTRKNDLRDIELQRQQIETDRETFLFNTQLQNQNTNGIIDDLRGKIKQDDRIISLRENIHSKSVLKVQNGTETVNEMLRDVNAVSEARQQKALHEIQLLQQIYNLKDINNN